jgi:hypothetical protein
MFTLGLLLAATLAADPAPPTSAPAKSDKPRIFVNDLTPQGVSDAEALAVRDAVVAALAGQGLFDVISTRDVQTLLGAERQKQLLGACVDETQCAADASQLLNARFVLSGQLSRLGEAVQLQLAALDTQQGKPVGRATRIAPSMDALRQMVPYAAAESVGAPLPPPPTKVPSISLIAVGGGTVLAGGIIGLQALATENALNEELCPGGAQEAQRCGGANLNPRDYYLAQNQDLSLRKGVAVGLLVGGAALTALGVILFPPEVARPSFALKLVPGPGSLALVGSLP